MNNKENLKTNTNNKLNNTNYIIAFIIFAIIIFVMFKIITGWWDGLGNNSNDRNKEPDKIELMSYAQTVLSDNLYHPKFSSYKEDYEFTNTGLKYKIEGKVNNEKFWMIIEFTDETYENYDLISLQIGNKKY